MTLTPSTSGFAFATFRVLNGDANVAERDQLFRNSVREKADMTELKLKAKPKPQIDTWKQAAE